MTGYYRIRWYAPGPVAGKPRDFCLAADEMRFVCTGIPLRSLPFRAARTLSKRFRYKCINAEIVNLLLRTLRSKRDCTQGYLLEIDRLERFNQFRTGYRYTAGWERKRPFDWEAARLYLKGQPREDVKGKSVRTTTRNNRWVCSKCRTIIYNIALLKRCSNCGSIGTLRAK